MKVLTESQWKRYDELLEAAGALTPAEQGSALTGWRVAGEDPLVLSLLAIELALEQREKSARPLGAGMTFGNYQILQMVGEGGMGVVFKARQSHLNREVALKLIRTADQATDEARNLFLREAQAVASLHHEHIVQVHEYGDIDRRAFLSMEYMEGGSLQERVGHDSLLSNLEAAVLVGQLASAVQHAHEQGIVHRDLKPGNILLDKNGTPKVSDFGLAKSVTSPDQTQTLSLAGTPSYMAPEQAGQGTVVGPPADIYALGAILYFCLTGRPPFGGSSPVAVLDQVRHQEPVPPRRIQATIHRDLETICLKCLHKTASRRYGSAKDLADDLTRFREGRPIQARRTGVVEKVAKWACRNPGWAALIVFGVVGAFGVGISLCGLYVRDRYEQARHLVKVLTEAEPPRIPGLLKELEPLRPYARPYLQTAAEEFAADERGALHARLGLLGEDPASQVEPIIQRAGSATPKELLMLQQVLHPHAAHFRAGLWRQVSAESRPVPLNHLGLLAALDPDNGRWGKVAPAVVAELARQDVLALGDWIALFAPVRESLAPAFLSLLEADDLRDLHPTLRRILADYARDQPDLLADAILSSGRSEDHRLWDGLAAHPATARRRMRQALGETPPRGTEEAMDRAALKRAKAAAVLLWLADANEVWTLFRRESDQRLRSFLIHQVALGKVDPHALLAQIEVEKDPGIRQALLLALGEFSAERLPEVSRQRAAAKLLDLYRSDCDPGVHGAADWLLRQKWGLVTRLKKVDQELQQQALHSPGGRYLPPSSIVQGQTIRPPTWYVDARGQTMTLIRGPVTFHMGAPESEPDRLLPQEALHPRTIGRTFAIATREVTFREFQAFLKANPKHEFRMNQMDTLGPDDPMTSISWYDAAAYCNWLSREEKLKESEWCYVPSGGKFAKGMQIAGDFLRRTGYRLATEAEWEYACRAGTTTARYYGFSEALLDRYAWYQVNGQDRPHPVGQLKPNDLGLFDMFGNALEWVSEVKWERYVEGNLDPTKDGAAAAGPLTVLDGQERSLRGATFTYTPRALRAAARFTYQAGSRQFRTAGFRIARTWPD